MRIAKALKKRLVKWLLDPSVIKEIELPIIKVGKNTVVVTPNGVKFSPLTADPTLQQALLWYRSDLDQWRYSPDGSNVKQLGGGYPPDDTYICLDTEGKLTICDGAVDSAKLANGAVTTAKLATLDYITLKQLTADPTLSPGRLWFRSDRNELRIGMASSVFSVLTSHMRSSTITLQGRTVNWKPASGQEVLMIVIPAWFGKVTIEVAGQSNTKAIDQCGISWIVRSLVDPAWYMHIRADEYASKYRIWEKTTEIVSQAGAKGVNNHRFVIAIDPGGSMSVSIDRGDDGTVDYTLSATLSSFPLPAVIFAKQETGGCYTYYPNSNWYKCVVTLAPVNQSV